MFFTVNRLSVSIQSMFFSSSVPTYGHHHCFCNHWKSSCLWYIYLSSSPQLQNSRHSFQCQCFHHHQRCSHNHCSFQCTCLLVTMNYICNDAPWDFYNFCGNLYKCQKNKIMTQQRASFSYQHQHVQEILHQSARGTNICTVREVVFSTKMKGRITSIMKPMET